MAITRGQQVKQMLREGGRIGLFKGTQADTKQGKSMSPGTSAGGGSRFSGADDRREQASVASTLGKKTPTAQEVRNIVSKGPDDRGNFLQNRNQRNIVKYNQDLKKIEENKNLNSFITLNKENAILKAENIDKESPSLLNGIPIAQKDLFCTKDLRTTCGSNMLSNFIPPYSATVIENLEKQVVFLLVKRIWMNLQWGLQMKLVTLVMY